MQRADRDGDTVDITLPPDRTAVLSTPGSTPTETEGDRPGENTFVPPSTPSELATSRFRRSFWGYRTDEVDAHLLGLAKEWESIIFPAATTAGILTTTRERIEGKRPYDSLGEDVSGILTEANSLADRKRAEGAEDLARAQSEAATMRAETAAERERILAGTTGERDEILARTRREADDMLAEARAEAARLITKAQEERARLDASSAELRERLSGIVANVGPLLAAAPEVPAPVSRDEREVRNELIDPPTVEISTPPNEGGLELFEEAMSAPPSPRRSRKRAG